ncbi:MAG TPA: hypothetical protein VGN16_03885 [Acidobacteriaceae bacterium]
MALSKQSTSYSFGNIKLGPHEVIIGFEVEVSGGGYESISSLPKGWRTAIDSRSHSEAKMNADLAFGDEGITSDILKDIVITLSQIEGMQFKVIGHMLISNLGTERRILLSKANFIQR